ncbi:MAG TPA: spherulation-specific family 4 protein [Natronosporangium sp.]
MTPTLLPLYVHPRVDPAAWRAAGNGSGELTVIAEGPVDAELTDAVGRLAKSGVATLGRVDVAFATRPVADLLDEVEGWAGCPVAGVFLDQAPTSPFCLGPIALAIRVARRAGLFTVVLNPGVPTDPLYRELDIPICTFEGSWAEYRRWTGEGALPGDGHLVHSVPADAMATARALLRERRAGWGLVTDRTPPNPYAGPPAWL